MRYQLVLTFLLVRGSPAKLIRILDIDPETYGACPTGLLLTSGSGGRKLCTRSAHPSSSVLLDTQGIMSLAADMKGLRKYDHLNGTIEAFQKGTPEAFMTGIRDSSSLDSSDYVDGLSITIGSPRRHAFTLAVSISYDEDGDARLCPCGAGTVTLGCGGHPPPAFVGNDLACDSGNLGTAALGWAARRMTAHFDLSVDATADDVEVRPMCDQEASNEDVGFALLRLDVAELEDHDPPTLQLFGPQSIGILVGVPWYDPGAACEDAVDGPLVSNVTGDVDVTRVGTQLILYTCEDLRTNSASATRTVHVLDSTSPTVTLRAGERLCVLEHQDYAEFGAECYDNVDGLFEATVTGNVDTSTLGSYLITYDCVDLSGNLASATRRVLVIGSPLPGNLMVDLVKLQTDATGSQTTAGWRTTLTNVNPGSDIHLHWSSAFKLNREECRFLTLLKQDVQGSRVVRRFESSLLDPGESVAGHWLNLAHGSNATFSESLEALASYTIILDEHFVLEAGGEASGSVRQTLHFSTGDYTAPRVLGTTPADGELAFPVSQAVRLAFGKEIQAGENAGLHLRLVEDGSGEDVPCNGSMSPSGIQIVPSGKEATVALGSWGMWRACRDYTIEIDAGCFFDTSVNRNPSEVVGVFQFVTSCVTALSPAHDSINVPVTSPLVITFAKPIQIGTGEVQLQPLGEEALSLAAHHFPMVYTADARLVVDPACRTDTCRILAAQVTPGAIISTEPNASLSMGLCAGRPVQQCRGKVYKVRVGASTVRFAHDKWPASSLLNGTDALPAQLEAGAYRFTVKPADLTPPELLFLEVVATSESSVRVTAHLNEAGTMHCAAFLDPAGAPCTAPVLVHENSAGRCSNETRDDCKGCGPPSFGCLDATAMWVDDGCSGRFRLHGQELDCQSWELERATYDNGGRSMLSLGQRHGCAIRKHTGDSMPRCWGKADNVDPASGLPPAVNLSSVSTGFMHTCGVQAATQELLCWGVDQHGETHSPSGAFASVTSGYRFSCALRADNAEAECWGLNDLGQASPPSAVPFLAVSAGNRHVCGIRANDSAAQCWGWNSDGQSRPPAGVRFLARGPGGTPLPEATISAGWYHTCAIRAEDGRVQCWGSNVDGQSAPPRDAASFVEVVAGRAHTCGIHKTLPGFGIAPNCTVQCWGLNDHGQASPPSGVMLNAIAADDDYTCGLRLGGGFPTCWGRNDYGQASPPPAESFGVLDEFAEVVCSISTLPDKQRILGHDGIRDAGASVAARYSVVDGYASVALDLVGLAAQTRYWVYCFAEDEELPTPNTMSNQQLLATQRLVTTFDTVAPVMQVLAAGASSMDLVEVAVRLSEPGTAYCVAVRDQGSPPTAGEIVATGSSGVSGADLVALVRVGGLSPDTELDVYCTAHDRAHARGHGARNNWASHEAVLLTKRDVHTMFDSSPPLLEARLPAHQGFLSCTPDGSTPGCMTAMQLVFNEDIRRGSGNLSLICMTNLASCTDVVVPMESPSFEGGSTFIENRALHVELTSPLVDSSTFKVVISTGAVKDLDENPFELDEECEFWFDQRWQTSPRPCAPSYLVQTPS